MDTSSITKKILQSFENEQIDQLSGVYGDRAAGDPVEVDRLEIKFNERDNFVTVFNRGIAMLFTNSDEISRLDRFFGVLERELADAT